MLQVGVQGVGAGVQARCGQLMSQGDDPRDGLVVGGVRFDRGRVDFFSTASQPPARHRATSLPTQTVEIPYCRATDPCDWPARTASTMTRFFDILKG